MEPHFSFEDCTASCCLPTYLSKQIRLAGTATFITTTFQAAGFTGTDADMVIDGCICCLPTYPPSQTLYLHPQLATSHLTGSTPSPPRVQLFDLSSFSRVMRYLCKRVREEYVTSPRCSAVAVKAGYVAGKLISEDYTWEFGHCVVYEPTGVNMVSVLDVVDTLEAQLLGVGLVVMTAWGQVASAQTTSS